jgi:hypothetical protein
VLLRRGEFHAAGREVEELLPPARAVGYGEFLAPALVIGAEVALATGDPQLSRSFVDEFVEATASNPEYWRIFLPVAVRVLVAGGATEEASRILAAGFDPNSRRLRLSMTTARAIVEEARGELEAADRDFREVADHWEEYGFTLEEARTRTGLARCLVGLGRLDEAAMEIARARELLEPLGARPMLEEVEALEGRTAASRT